jgi:hypothetical protein
MHDTALNALTIRLHKPYWLLHAGDCEHFLVFEHIRHVNLRNNTNPSLTFDIGCITYPTHHYRSTPSQPKSPRLFLTLVVHVAKFQQSMLYVETSDWVTVHM